MKSVIENKNFNLYEVMRSAGYHPDRDQRKGLVSFSRSILSGRYPRFHLYYSKEKEEITLHLDQKPARYKNAPDHGAEYDGDLVEKEAKRLSDFFQ